MGKGGGKITLLCFLATDDVVSALGEHRVQLKSVFSMMHKEDELKLLAANAASVLCHSNDNPLFNVWPHQCSQ
jgi:hypothetical protein